VRLWNPSSEAGREGEVLILTKPDNTHMVKFFPMKQLLSNRTFLTGLGFLVLLLLVLVTGSIDSLDLRPGSAFEYGQEIEAGVSAPASPPDLEWVIILAVSVFCVVTILILIFSTKKQRKYLLIIIAIALASLLGIMWWISRAETGNPFTQATATFVHTPQIAAPSLVQGTQVPISTYTAPVVSPWISILITFLGLCVMASLVWLYLRKRYFNAGTLNTFIGISERTINELQLGKDYGDTILNCYSNMIQVIDKERGIRRQGNLTPDEFISVLLRARFPEEPVRHLTKLFEMVRYGGGEATEIERQEAVACLAELIGSNREKK
jgi:hypothetical protein